MAYLLNTVNLSTYGIIAGHAPSSNISLQGCFDLPVRTGKCFHSWGDADSIEPYVAASEIFFAGRDIKFYGSILGSTSVVNAYLKSFYDAIKLYSALVVFSTPYGDFSGYVKNVSSEMLNGGAKIVMTFREPVVTLTGTLPATGASNYAIDSIPFLSFGLYLSKADALHDLPELKDQYFTKYGSEGCQITKRKNNTLDITGFIVGNSLAEFQSKVSALHKLFSSPGTRTIILNNKMKAICFATEGFSIEDVILYSSGVIAGFKASLLCESVAIAVTYNDYFLPSKNELSKMYVNLESGTDENSVSYTPVGNFIANYYWSSSEDNTYSAFAIRFSNGVAYSRQKDSANNYFRPCRRFYSSTVYSLRDTGPAGGWIFYIEEIEEGLYQYYETAPINYVDTNTLWSNVLEYISNTDTVIGSGQTNTTIIINQDGHTNSAAKLCTNLQIIN